MSSESDLPVLDHADLLADVDSATLSTGSHYSCSFCGVGDSGSNCAAEPGSKPRSLPSIRPASPTSGCVKFQSSLLKSKAPFPLHIAPTQLERATGRRRTISYDEAIMALAELLLEYRTPGTRTLVYACGQIDYFAIFAIQEVFRLLGVRNLTGNAEHCLNAGAVHNEMLTGQEGPFITIEQALRGPERFYLFNGWNGAITHPPVFRGLMQRDDLDAYLVDVMMTESAEQLAQRLGSDRVLLIRPGSDPHLALGVANELLRAYPGALDQRFIRRFADAGSFAAFTALAAQPEFMAERVAERIAPEPDCAEPLLRGMRRIAQRIAQTGSVPINIPSVGLSQTSGAVGHCIWGNLLALAGKYGLRAPGEPAGGTLRLPGQINAESEVQGLSSKFFVGRIPIAEGSEAARRMGLPEDAYQRVLQDLPRLALDYSDPTPGVRELFICFGTQFEANMMNRARWIEKLENPDTRLVVIDPIPDPFSVDRADLIIPSPPHVACTKLYQNGEWRLTLSMPRKQAAEQTATDATIVYDTMAAITRCLESNPSVAAMHPDLSRHQNSGYLAGRFCPPKRPGTPGLSRVGREVSREELWHRVQAYLGGGSGPLYCRFEHADERPIEWCELVSRGTMIYGGVGQRRYLLDYSDGAKPPFADVFRRSRPFRFFSPTAADLEIPTGIILNSGRSSLSDDPERIAFATATFNSGKATPTRAMPDEHPLYVSELLARRLGLKSGQRARVTGTASSASIVLPVIVSDRLKGELAYVSFHKSRAQMEHGTYVNAVTSHVERCAYTGQTRLKASSVAIRPLATATLPLDTTRLKSTCDVPAWASTSRELYVIDKVQETHDVTTFRFQSDPLCRFEHLPGQYGTIAVTIRGTRYVRAYTFASSPSRPYALEITVKRVLGGVVSNWLIDELNVGDRLEIGAAKGSFVLVPGAVPRKLLLLGAGSGITPLMSMARWLTDLSANVDATLLNFTRTPQDIIFRSELSWLAQRSRVNVTTVAAVAGPGSDFSGPIGLISRALLYGLVPDLLERELYLCGPEGFMSAVQDILLESGYPLSKLHVERFTEAHSSSKQSRRTLPPFSSVSAPDFGVRFSKSGKSLLVGAASPLLEVAESHGIRSVSGCRAGMCGECKVLLLHGAVDMECDEGLSVTEKSAGYILPCVARPKADCVVEM